MWDNDSVADFLSFKMRDEFLAGYQHSPEWGMPMGAGNLLGEYMWFNQYSRRKPGGSKERYWEGLRRVIEGMYSIQKDHAANYRLPWDEETAHASAQEAYARAFAGKWSPPGRGLWMMGTELVNGRGDSSALQNCAFISTGGVAATGDPSLPFTRLMDMSMLGVGVGFDVAGAGKLCLHQPEGRIPHQVADSREGWCEATGHLLRAFLLPGRKLPVFDYSKVRPAGSPIKGFGGIASGPEPLRKLHVRLVKLLGGREGSALTSADITDIMNMTGKCVVSANVRRSAEIALGPAGDESFLDLKDWVKNPERMGPDGWGHLSNNSVYAQTGGDYSFLAGRIALNGEPGLFWLDVAKRYGRLADPPDGKEYRTAGVNPCGEQPLENNELCTLVETYPSRCDGMKDFLRTLKFAYLYGKTVTLLMTRWPETNEVMIRNRRIGTSITGVAQFAEEHGWAELRVWQDAGYSEIRRWDRIYSEWLGVRESIRVTTVKPSGTVSLLWGVTPGVHWPRERGFYAATFREQKGSPLLEALMAAGYPAEPSVMDPDEMMVVTVPLEGPQIRPEREVSIWEKTALAAQCQRWWADNAVSATITFREDEVAEIPRVLRAFDGQLKSISLLPMAEGTYPQAPLQRIPREEWEALRAAVKPVNWDALYAGGDGSPDARGELYCTTDRCEVP
jgi:ribonucleoside-triphosphate reductase (thioredoxin)